MRLLASATTALALCALSACATPVSAGTTRVVYGHAWADGTGHLRILPQSATAARKQYKLKAIPGAKELRLGYTKAAYLRVAVACHLKETEGHVALDAKNFGRTRCKPADLATGLASGPIAVRVHYTGRQAVKVTEFLPYPSNLSVVRGTVKRSGDRTLLFTRGGKTVKLGYTHALTFSRVTSRCDSGWLTGRPVNADRDGLGTKHCGAGDFTAALKKLRHPVLVQIDYQPRSGQVFQVWEVFGDA
ncbi:hypothetical protein [Nonomuraea sp. SBT364]|uniref:hypothetical protein n=1 Tax=Nonomuraea sp. SBT364 TaxID=1580530 RepID=UPI00066C3D9A|nr:hypothetical protein [Nonomuraea sp. SBT364]